MIEICQFYSIAIHKDLEDLNVILIKENCTIEYCQRTILNQVIYINYLSLFVAIESNGVLIGEFQPKKWYFLGIEHDKPYIHRP